MVAGRVKDNLPAGFSHKSAGETERSSVRISTFRGLSSWSLAVFAPMIAFVKAIGYINTTSTCECTFRTGFAAEYGRMPVNARHGNSQNQRLIG
jgi:hypothetical protein